MHSAPRHRQNLRILIVDHNPLTANVLQSMLKAHGFPIRGVENSSHATLRHLASASPDLICLDMDLPDGDSLDLLARIKRTQPRVHVVMTGTRLERSQLTRALAHGAVAYLEKPLALAPVLEILDLLAGLHEVEAPPEGDGPSVLVVDRNPEVRALLAHMLHNLDYHVVGEAASGMDGLILLERHRPLAVCMAIDTPDVGGLDALSAIMACHPDVAVIFVTSHAERETVSSAIRGGARGYILKPFTLENVRSGMHHALSREVDKRESAS